MKILGDKNMFAIQWREESREGGYLYGNLCFWIGGQQIGTFDEVSTLSISASYLKDFLIRKQERQLKNSCFKSKEEIFEFLYKRFFNHDSQLSNFSYSMGEVRDIFWLDEVGEYSFRDKIGMILLDEPECSRQRIIWETFNSELVKEFYLPVDYFDKVASDFLFEFMA